MSRRSKRLRRLRPCYTCGYRARHFKDNGGAESNADPCFCVACLRMPSAWRGELKDEWQRKLSDRRWSIDFNRRFHMKYPQYAAKPTPPMPKSVDLCAYAWPGGYQMMYYVGGDSVCPKCIMEVLRGGMLTGREELLRDIFYEGAPERCSHCNEEIESAYGDPDEEDEAEIDDSADEAEHAESP